MQRFKILRDSELFNRKYRNEMKKILAGMFFLLTAVGFFACSSGIDYEKLRREELAILDRYIEENYPDAEPTRSGLYYINEEGTGSGDTIQLGDQVDIFYATWVLYESNDTLYTGLVDQSSGYLDGQRYEPYRFYPGAGGSIAGLEEGIRYMQPGTRSTLIINSALAYGQSGSGSVGMFQTIIMEVEVYKVKPADSGEEDDDNEVFTTVMNGE